MNKNILLLFVFVFFALFFSAESYASFARSGTIKPQLSPDRCLFSGCYRPPVKRFIPKPPIRRISPPVPGRRLF